MAFSGLVLKESLDEAELQAVNALEEAVNAADQIQIKFNWSMMRHRPQGVVNDFCYYEAGQLVGYMPLDGFGAVIEITGGVLPAFRRRGIFRQLYEAAKKEARNRDVEKLLLVHYRESRSGTAVVEALHIPYDFSEYHMAMEAPALPLPASVIAKDVSGVSVSIEADSIEADLVKADPMDSSDLPAHFYLKSVEEADLPVLAEILTTNFGKSEMHSGQALRDSLECPEEPYYLALLDGNVIGHIGAMIGKENVYIRAVGILPEWRQRGFGRDLLSAAVRRLRTEGHLRFELDVATSNAGALTLYQSCGFNVAYIYDYYSVPLC